MPITDRLRQASFPGTNKSFAYRFARRYLQQIARTFHLTKPAYQQWAAQFIEFCQQPVFTQNKPPLTAAEAADLISKFLRGANDSE